MYQSIKPTFVPDAHLEDKHAPDAFEALEAHEHVQYLTGTLTVQQRRVICLAWGLDGEQLDLRQISKRLKINRLGVLKLIEETMTALRMAHDNSMNRHAA